MDVKEETRDAVMEKTEMDETLKPKRWLGIRHLEAFTLFSGIAIAYGLRVCMSVSIVAMTDSNNATDVHTFDWSKSTQDTILSSFFWGYVLSQVPAGVFAERFGGKLPIAVSMAMNGIICLLVPIAAVNGDWGAVCACRVIQGFFQGFFFPSTHALLGKWAPPSERGRLGTFVYAGAQFGTVVTLPLTGEVCGRWGWPTIFYAMGVASIIWTLLWLIVGADSPDRSRFISHDEKEYIMTSLGNSKDDVKLKTPWRGILTSLPVWSLVVVHCGQTWGMWMLLTEMPSYMKLVLEVDIKSNGLLSALPYFVMWLLSFVASYLSDFIINRQMCSVTITRKVFNTIGHWGPGLALLGLSYAPKNVTISVALLTITVGMNAGQYVGFNVNHIDLAPNFAGILMGITNGISNIFSIIAPLSVGLILTEETQTEATAWRPIFFGSAAIYFLCNLFWVLFGTSERQPWNEPNYNKTESDKEQQNYIQYKKEEDVKRY